MNNRCLILTSLLCVCFFSNLFAQNWWEWSTPISNEYISKLIVDNNGNSVSAGSNYSTGSYLKRLNRNGAELWKRQFAWRENLYNIDVDNSGNIYTTGLNNVINNRVSKCIRKFDFQGNQQWEVFHSGDVGLIRSGGDGSIYLVGSYMTSNNMFGDDTVRVGNLYQLVYGASPRLHMYVAKINSQGTVQWLRTFRFVKNAYLENFEQPNFGSMFVDELGHLWLTGEFITGTIYLDNEVITTTSQAGFLIQMNAMTGRVKWARAMQPRGGSYVSNNLRRASAMCYAAHRPDGTLMLSGNESTFSGSNYNNYYYFRTFDTLGNQLSYKRVYNSPSPLSSYNGYYHRRVTDSIQVIDTAGEVVNRIFTPGILGFAMSAGDGSYIATREQTSGLFRTTHICKIGLSNTVSGYVFKDVNSNGIKDSLEAGIPNITVGEAPNRSIAITDQNGYYECYVDSNSHHIQALSSIRYYQYLQNGYTVNFNGLGNVDSNRNFALTPIPNITDVRVLLNPINAARPGFNTYYAVQVKNNGTEPASGTTSAKLPEGISFESDSNYAEPAFSSPDSVLFTFNDLPPFADTSFYFKCTVSATLPIGTTVVHYANVVTTNQDSFPSDNIDTLYRWISGSFDPNDKQVFPEGNVHITEKGKPLNYMIRFQNTGNDTAFNVHIIDSLAATLDLSTFQLVSSSHRVSTKIDKNKVLHFYFDNINLVDSVHNEPMSHGYVRFSIKPLPEIAAGATIDNTAAIYFDYNAPVITNTTQTKYVVTVISSMLQRLVAQQNDAKVLLTFTTAFEDNLQSFNVERSSDGNSFVSIGSLNASGTASTYNFLDDQPNTGINFYRIQLKGLDGSLAYSQVQSVLFTGNKKTPIAVYPNPVQQMLYFDLKEKGFTRCRIFNAGGQLQKTITTTITQPTTLTVPTDHLAQGLYYLEVRDVTGVTVTRFIVNK